MEKRLVLAVALCMGILFAWWKLFPPPVPPPQVVAKSPAEKLEGVPGVAPPPGVATATRAAAKQGAIPAARPPEELVTLDTADATFTLSSWGGTLRQVRLKNVRFLEKSGDPNSGPRIVQTSTPERAPLLVTFPKADFQIPAGVTWTSLEKTATSVVFQFENEAVAVRKRYAVQGSRYRMNLQVQVHNKTDKSQQQNMALHLYGAQDPEKKGGGFFDYASANISGVVCFVNENAHRSAIEPLWKEADEQVGGVEWIAVDEKFFALAAVPYPDGNAGERKCGRRALDAVTGEAFVSLASRTLLAGGKTDYEFEIFAGPKDTGDLDAVRPGGQDAHLGKVVDVTFAVLSRPLLFLLKMFHSLVGNWGVAIILLTVFIKLVTFYPTQRALMSGKKMQKLAPKMAALRKKYENDRQRMGIETMNLYKSHGVSPFGGCLPSLIQMPIWIALFSTLNYSVELYRAGFLGYIHDLSARDPYFISPLVMGVVMFFQMRMSPAGADPQQQKMMSVMMPIMFTGFSLFLPAGLAVYTLTSYLIGITQQLLVNHLDKKNSGGTAVAHP